MRILESELFLKSNNLPNVVDDSILDELWANKIHGQSLERINERGGMSLIEIIINVDKLEYNSVFNYDAYFSIIRIKRILKLIK